MFTDTKQITKEQYVRYRELLFMQLIKNIHALTQELPLTLQYLDWCCKVIGGVDFKTIRSLCVQIVDMRKDWNKELIVLMYCSGMSVRDILKQAKVSNRTLYNALELYKNEDLALQPQFGAEQAQHIYTFLKGYAKIKEVLL